MKYALIGCGRIATNHIKAMLQHGLTLVAVCDIVPEHMQQLLEQHALADNATIARYQSHTALLQAHPDLELAAIATESGSHAEIALACIDAGVHVIIEKPMAMEMADADEIVRRSEEKGVTVCACHQNRFNLAVQRLRRAVEGGRFGTLSHGSVHVRWNRNRAYYEQAPWRGTWAQDGGCLMNQCIHGMDLLRWMLGDEIESVYGVTKRQLHGYLEAEDVGLAVVRFRNGAVATIEGTTNVYPKNLEETLCLFGETGTVKLGGTSVNAVDVWDFAHADPDDETSRSLSEATSNVYGNGHISLYGDVLRAIQTGTKPYVDARAGRNALELVLAVYASCKTGMPVTLPLTAFGSAQMQGFFGAIQA